MNERINGGRWRCNSRRHCGCKQLGFPTTVTGKVQKFALREMFVAEGAAG